MKLTTSWLEKNYTNFNNIYWNGKLPSVSFKINTSKQFLGYAQYYYDFSNNLLKDFSIIMSNYYTSTEISKQNTLLHEMIHIADYYFHPEHFVRNHRPVKNYNSHGEAFFMKEARRINESGWHISNTATDFETKSFRISPEATKKYAGTLSKSVMLIFKIDKRYLYARTDESHYSELTKYYRKAFKELSVAKPTDMSFLDDIRLSKRNLHVKEFNKRLLKKFKVENVEKIF